MRIVVLIYNLFYKIQDDDGVGGCGGGGGDIVFIYFVQSTLCKCD
jgi:hypothetical protein